MAWWFTPDVSSWPKSNEETIGRRAKHWVTDPTGTEWLRKQPLASRPHELAIESLTLELARRCGYPVAFGTCCTWTEGDQTIRGFVSRKFQDALEAQTSGGELVAPALQLGDDLTPKQQEKQRRIMTTLAAVRQALVEQQERLHVNLLEPFVRMLVFDAWIGNGDRHSANWAILIRSELHGSACRLAPMYDTAGCLLSEQMDVTVADRYAGELENAALASYIDACGSGFGDGEKLPGVRHSALLKDLTTWPEWQKCAPGLVSFFANNFSMVEGVISEVPDDWLSARRKVLIARVLEGRVKMLQGVMP